MAPTPSASFLDSPSALAGGGGSLTTRTNSSPSSATSTASSSSSTASTPSPSAASGGGLLTINTEHISHPPHHRRTHLRLPHHKRSASDVTLMKKEAEVVDGGERDEPVTKGTWMPAALFIFVSHVLVFLYFICFIHHRLFGPPLTTPQSIYDVSARMMTLTFVSVWLNLLGITAGYHRLWSHRAFKACFGLRVFLAIIGLCSFQGSAYWWVLKHRLHHRFTDTPSDPYDSTRGLWYSHIGWLYEAPPFNEKVRLISMTDLNADPVVVFQKKYLLYGYVLFGGLIPGLIGLLTDSSFFIGVFWIGFIGRFLSWHCIWTINSLSHWHGFKEFSHLSSAVYVAIVNLIQNGEGHHNYHHVSETHALAMRTISGDMYVILVDSHPSLIWPVLFSPPLVSVVQAFPRDYRHGHRWYEWDPTKWCINLWYACGWATDLQQCDQNQIQQARVKTMEWEMTALKKQLQWPMSEKELPTWTMNDSVLDVTSFTNHPGGFAYLRQYHGHDIAEVFEGEINLHTEAATNLAWMYRVARITPTTLEQKS